MPDGSVFWRVISRNIRYTAIQYVTDSGRHADIGSLSRVVVIQEHLRVLQTGLFDQLALADFERFYIFRKSETHPSSTCNSIPAHSHPHL